MRVTELDMTDNSTQCPSGLRLNDTNLHTCGINSSGNLACSSATFNLNGIKYSSVHGVIRAYGCGSPDAYGIAEGQRQSSDLDIDSNYVDGISLTYGMTPRQHIWTFAVDNDETGCENSPSFVHNDYYCGDINNLSCNSNIQDIQWIGGSCGSQSQCCSLINPTQFYKQLPQLTTDDIEMRLCRDQSASNENIFLEMIDIYVQ